MLLVLTVLALAAVINGAWLTYVHANLVVGKDSAVQVCHALSRDGCAITAGEYGMIGGVPIALIGAAGAMGTLLVGIVAFVRRREADEPFRAAALLLALISVAASLVMAGISAKEGSYCPFCVAWYGINLGLGGAAWSAAGPSERRPADVLRRASGAPMLVVIAAFAFTLAGGLHLDASYQKEQTTDRDDFLRQQVAAVLKAGKTKLPMDMMQTSGPEDADVTIVEVADFECPHCRKLWDGISAYKAGTDRTVRTAFVHFPLDTSCNARLTQGGHKFACDAAFAAECAGDQGKFFEYGAALFEHQRELERESLLSYARDLSLDMTKFETCLDAPITRMRVELSIDLAELLQVRATPTFFINGYKFEGARAPAILAATIEALMTAGEPAGADESPAKADAPPAKTP